MPHYRDDTELIMESQTPQSPNPMLNIKRKGRKQDEEWVGLRKATADKSFAM